MRLRKYLARWLEWSSWQMSMLATWLDERQNMNVEDWEGIPTFEEEEANGKEDA